MTEANQDARILFPEREFQIAGERITVHEFTFAEGLRLAHHVNAVVSEFVELLGDIEDMRKDDDPSLVSRLQQAFGQHPQATRELLAACCGREPEWVDGLKDSDGTALLMAMWLVNQDFFMRRLRVEVNAVLEARHGVPSASAGSSPH